MEVRLKNTITLLSSASATFALGFSSVVMADDVANVVNKAINAGKDALYTDAPDWMQRTTIEIQVEKDYKPTVELETVQPIMQHNSKDDMVFYQLNARTRDSKNSYNVGLGYRNIISEDMMYGVNIFYDRSIENNHRRNGLGLELMSKDYEARANAYKSLSNKKEVSANSYEEALDGWDFEIGGSIVPYDKNLKVYLSHSKFNTVSSSLNNYEDNRIRAVSPITNKLTVELGRVAEKEKYGAIDKERNFAKFKYSLGGKANRKPTNSGLRDKLLQPVERRHEIILEKTINASVTVARGT